MIFSWENTVECCGCLCHSHK